MSHCEECEPCIMLKYNCLIVAVAEELIQACPCHKCIVKVTCKYDDVCDSYNDYMEVLYYDEKYKRKVEQYETLHNSYN